MFITFKYILIPLYMICVHLNGNAQNYIGMHKDEIIQVMKETQKNCKLNTSTVNTHYNYLKFEDKISEITILYFLSEEDSCTLVRKMCDYSNLNDVLTELNNTYTSIGTNLWEYKDQGNVYSVTLTEEDWFFTVTTRLKEE